MSIVVGLLAGGVIGFVFLIVGYVLGSHQKIPELAAATHPLIPSILSHSGGSRRSSGKKKPLAQSDEKAWNLEQKEPREMD